MFFDTETTSISPPIVCQLAFVVFESGIPVFQYDNVLTLPANTTVAPQAFKVHGISTRDCSTKGVCAVQALEFFAATAKGILSQGGRVVAHNSQFDCRAIQTTRNAWSIIGTPENPELSQDDFFCTMKESKKHSNLFDKRGHRKAFKNSELYQHFHDGREPTWARLHSAIDDVLVTAHNYISGEHAEWW
jgi:DNA polymerase III epsilon subunit-like protein